MTRRALRRRHRDWLWAWRPGASWSGASPRQREVAARWTELPNLRSAPEYCPTEPDEAHLGQYLAGALWFHWVGCGRLSEGRRWLEQAVRLDVEGTAGEQSRLKALWVLGYVAILQGDTVPALAALQECRRRPSGRRIPRRWPTRAPHRVSGPGYGRHAACGDAAAVRAAAVPKSANSTATS
ncbi:hypothetical protein LV779_12060 [Streptomyces thinghirensis]|nr:hypothetical protein [Streptomyces thinghirensis]